MQAALVRGTRHCKHSTRVSRPTRKGFHIADSVRSPKSSISLRLTYRTSSCALVHSSNVGILGSVTIVRALPELVHEAGRFATQAELSRSIRRDQWHPAHGPFGPTSFKLKYVARVRSSKLLLLKGRSGLVRGEFLFAAWLSYGGVCEVTMH